MKIYTVIVAGLIAVLVSCNREDAMKPVLPITTNASDILSECRKLAADWKKLGKTSWDKTDVLPPIITSLSPQLVDLNVSDEATVVDIQVSGGFNHRGLLVVCESKESGFVPQKGRDWQIKKVAGGVFQYSE